MKECGAAAGQAGDEDGPFDHAVQDLRIVGFLLFEANEIDKAAQDIPSRRSSAEDAEIGFLLIGPEKPRQRVDSLEGAVWGGRLKGQVSSWAAGDAVDVSGALRRRFFRAGGAPASRVEVELTRGRIIRRAGSG